MAFSYVKKGNKLLQVKDFQVQRYLDLGYDEVNEVGEVIKASVPNDINSLKRAYLEKEQEIAELKERNQELEETVTALEEKLTETTKANSKSKSKAE